MPDDMNAAGRRLAAAIQDHAILSGGADRPSLAAAKAEALDAFAAFLDAVEAAGAAAQAAPDSSIVEAKESCVAVRTGPRGKETLPC